MAEAREALKRLSYGVYVVTARRGDVFNAMTVRMAMQVSVRPPCVAIAVARRRLTHTYIQDGGIFAVNVLGRNQAMLGGHFGLRSGRDRDKLAGADYELGLLGLPLLKEACAHLECRVVDSRDYGNCTLFVGEVVASAVTRRAPLVYRESDYFG